MTDAPSAEYISARLAYDQENGSFAWKPRTVSMFTDGTKTAEHECSIWNAKHAGKLAGRINPGVGYVEISIDEQRYGAHRLAYLMMTGAWPDEVDHINHVRSDNRWSNLRHATRATNNQNMSSHRDSTSKFVGVCWDARRKKWKSAICVDRRSIFIGRFDTEAEAHAAYLEKKRSVHIFAGTT